MLRHPMRLVLTFDAFGTLFTPREPIEKSYANIARKYGLSGFTDDKIASNFRDAFKKEQSKAPNYGKLVGMGAPQWWSHVIHTTFRPFSSSPALPKKLVQDLLSRFGSSEGYTLYSDVIPLFEELCRMRNTSIKDPSSPKLVVGLITNSDDRVPSVLSSLGLRVNPRRHGPSAQSSNSPQDGEDDIDFVVMSYDVGHEKPSREIFDAAKHLVHSVTGYENHGDRFIHVGDDIMKDFTGAKQAGWESVLLDREGNHSKHGTQEQQTVTSIVDLRDLRSSISPDATPGL